jgi:hypothetical protein
MTERDLQDRVRKMCGQLGLAVQHIEDSRRCWLPGWPDLSIFGTSAIFAELKRQDEDLTPQQRKVGRVIASAGLRWVCWKPADLLDGTIAFELTAISGRKIAAFMADPCPGAPHCHHEAGKCSGEMTALYAD